LILIILFSFITLTLSGCSQLFGWKYDTEELSIGLSQSEVEDVWGEPSSVYITGSYTLWDYTKLHNDGAYESYTLTFENGTLTDWTIYRSND
jgi:hypothetical protein